MGTKHRARAVLVALAALVAAGMAVLPVDSAAAAADLISGTVAAEGGTDVSYNGVEVFTLGPDGDWEWFKYQTTDADGHFSVSLPHGQYRVEFLASDGDHVPVFYGGAADLDSATTVDNTSGPVNGIDGVIPIGGKIVGTVPQFKTHGGFVEAYVESTPGNWTLAGYNGADTVDGGFTVTGLPTGSYKVLLKPFGPYAEEYYDNSPDLEGADTVAVTKGSTSGPINATLAPIGKIAGHVITSAGANLAHVRVDAYRKVGSSWKRVIRFQGGTDDHGRYQLPLEAGVYRIKFGDTKGRRAFEYWPNVRSITKATSITVTAGNTVTNKNAIMERGGSIAGSVLFPTGVPTSAVLWQTNENVENLATLYNAVTGEVVRNYKASVLARVGEADGFGYKFVGLPAGKYRIAFARASQGVSNIEAQFYSGKPESVGFGDASVITLGSGQARTGMNARTRLGGTLTGYVLRSDGSPAEGCRVYAYTGDGSRGARGGVVGSDGQFRVQGLTTGAYRLRVVASFEYDPLAYREHCQTTEYYQGGSGALTKTQADGIAVHVTATRDTLLATPLYYGLGTAPSLSTIQKTTLPSITGTAHVGQTLTANPGVWSPTPDKVRYQWLRDGFGIAGEIGSKHYLRAADKGHKISVRISAYVSGQNPNTAVSAAKTVS